MNVRLISHVAFCATILMAVSPCASAQWLGGLGAAADSASKSMDRQIDFENQKELLQLRYKLETEREIAELKRQDQQRRQLEQAKLDEDHAKGDAYLESYHPGWRNTVRTKSFTDWLAVQPKNIKDLAESNQYASASALLYVYEASMGKVLK